MAEGIPNQVSPTIIIDQRGIIYPSLQAPVSLSNAIDWFQPWTEPVRLKAIRFGSQQVFSIDTDPVVSFSWFAEMNKPRFQHRARYLEDQSAYFFVEAPAVEDIPTLDVPGIYITRQVELVAY